MQIQNFKQRQSSEAIEARFLANTFLQKEQSREAFSVPIKKKMKHRNYFEHQLEIARHEMKHMPLKVENDKLFNPVLQ